MAFLLVVCRRAFEILALMFMIFASCFPSLASSRTALVEDEGNGNRMQKEGVPSLRNFRPKISAMGLVLCDPCNLGLRDKSSVPFPDVEVKVQCRDVYGIVIFSAVGYTNESGLFSIPMDDIPSSFDAEGCKATLVRSVNQDCGDLSSKIKDRFDTSLVLKINSSTDLVFTIASFSFHASPPPKSCHEASGYMRSSLGRLDDSHHRSILPESINTEKASISHSHTDYALPVALSPPRPSVPQVPRRPQLISSPSSLPHHWSRSLLSFDEALSPLLSTEVSYTPFLKSPSDQAYFSSLHRYKDHSPPPPPPSYHAPSHPSFPSSPSLPQYYAPPPPPPYYYAPPPPPQSPYDVKISSSPPLSDYEDLFPFQYFHHPQSSSLSDVDDEAKLYTDHETSQVKVPRAFHLFHNPLLKELSSPWTSHGSKSTKASTVLHRSSDRSPYSRNSPVLVNAKRIQPASSAHRRHVETSHSRYRRSTYISIQKLPHSR